LVDVDYNKRAFIYGSLVFAIGFLFMFIGTFDSPYAINLLILGGIISIVGALSLFVLGGIIFALRLYSEEDL
jgi:hypothetical protein